MVSRYQGKNYWIELMIAFFVTTSTICVLEGTMGMLFAPDVQLSYEAFFMPPLFGAGSVLLGLVNYSKKELTVRQVLCRRIVHLILVEGMVFGSNFAVNAVFTLFEALSLALSIALVFVLVYVVLYLSDSRDAKQFNRELKQFQEAAKETEISG